MLMEHFAYKQQSDTVSLLLSGEERTEEHLATFFGYPSSVVDDRETCLFIAGGYYYLSILGNTFSRVFHNIYNDLLQQYRIKVKP